MDNQELQRIGRVLARAQRVAQALFGSVQFRWAALLTLGLVCSLLLPPARLFPIAGQYLSVHTVLEFLAMAVSVMVFALAWNLRGQAHNNRLVLLGCGFLAMCLIDLAHTLSYTGMPDMFTPSGAEKAINFWLAARITGALVLLLVVFTAPAHWSPVRCLGALVVTLGGVALVWWVCLSRADWLPRTFIPGSGLTPLKVNIEYVVAACYAIPALLLSMQRGDGNPDHRWLAAAAWTQALAELYFTLYADVTDVFNLLGHVYKAAAYLMAYRALFVAGVQLPYQLLEVERSRLETLLATLPDPVWLKSVDGTYLSCNEAFGRLSDTPAKAVIGKTDHDLFDPALAEFFILRDKMAQDANRPICNEEWIPVPGEGLRLFETTKVLVKTPRGAEVGILGVGHDITARKRAADEIERLAFYDPLTQLPNRRLLFDCLRQALLHCAENGCSGALLLIDVDDFKKLNDTQGHGAGDQLLVQTAARIKENIRAGDTLARLGGDEFVVIMQALDQGEAGLAQARQLAAALLQALHAPYVLTVDAGMQMRRSYHCTCSIGVTLFGGDHLTAETVLQQADTAMFQAKSDGRDTISLFDQQLQDRLSQRASLEEDMRTAIVERQFELFYQPQLNGHGDVVGAEALLRWMHPQRGMISPADFIPLAEESGLIVLLGQWVIETACQQLARWALREEFAHLTLAVNVSSRQFRLPSLVEEVRQMLLTTGIAPERLKLELTESLLLENTNEVIGKMASLKGLGINFSLDDFGTGYSSLSYLKRLPLYQLKIDRSFVADVQSDPNDAAICRTILALGHSLGLQVIAEGVETREQRDFLADNACDAFQGFYFSKPLPLQDFESYVLRTAATQACLSDIARVDASAM